MVSAMRKAITGSGRSSRATATTRDLFTNPVRGQELLSFDAVVVNPPRTGAEPQIEALSNSRIPLVVLVSCNPRALERDAAHLARNDFALEKVVPVDQFYWTVHIESVSVFRRIGLSFR
jgi:23S rRNA (uracil1939-C5)-methyltransferase